MPRFVVHARVTVPVWGQLTVEAETPDEAQEKAMAAVEGADGSEAEEWESKLWQDGEWTKDIRWEAADNFTVEDVVEDERGPETNEKSA